MCNFWSAVTPKKYLHSILIGEIFRAYYTTSNDENLNVALEKLTQQYLRNKYPIHLIKRKIAEVKSRNFKSRNNKEEYQTLINNNPQKYHTLSLAFTSKECEQIGYDIVKILKEVTPDYSLNIAWRNEKLARFYSARLKLSTSKFDKIGTLYQFNCPGCSVQYVGETKRKLMNRIKEHSNPTHNSAISKHVYQCKNYLEKLNEEYPDSSDEEKTIFISGNFSILQSNLSKYRTRKTVEAIEIKLNKPYLNNQIFSRTINFF